MKGINMSSVKKIAEIAGLSVATVSRVMHQSDSVKPETRRRVEEAMKLLDVTSNDLVRNTKTNSNLIGVVVPDLANSFFTEVISGIHEVASKLNFDYFVCNTKENSQTELRYLRLLKEAHVKGIIIAPVSDDHESESNKYLQLLSSMNISIVLVDRDIKYSNYDGVFINNVRGAFDVTSNLLENGHRRIAIIAGPQNTLPGRERLQGYKEAFAVAGMKVDENLIFYGDFSIESGAKFTREIINKHSDVTAVFPVNNLMTLGCIDTLMRAGLKIPNDISVVGFDRIMAFEIIGINLTFVARPTYEMGAQTMKLLAKAIQRKSTGVPTRIILMPELNIRGSEKKLRDETIPLVSCGIKEKREKE
jgi:LacI family transcriptional regulator